MSERECFYCGDDHEDDAHEVLTSLDWGRTMVLHDGSAVDAALSEAESLGVYVGDLVNLRTVRAHDSDGDVDIDHECSYLDDIETRLGDAGYFAGSDSDGGVWYIAGPAVVPEPTGRYSVQCRDCSYRAASDWTDKASSDADWHNTGTGHTAYVVLVETGEVTHTA